VTRFYWVRFINVANVEGPFNSVNGTSATTGAAVDYLLTTLTGQITTSQLYADLATQIGQIAGNTTAVQTLTTVVNGVSGSYTVKVDNNGYVAGYGLASTANNATPFSEFAIRADRFYVASPSGPGITPIVPFIVNTTTQTVNGVSVPAGVYMDAAFIKNGTITNAKIGNAAIDDAKIANLSAAKITSGFIDAARIQAGSLDAKIANIDAAVIGSGTINSARIGNISADSITSGTLSASRIGSGTTYTYGGLPGSFSLGDTSATTLIGNTRAVGQFQINSNAGWALGAFNTYTSSGGEWANGAFFATKANGGVGSASYNVGAQSSSMTSLRSVQVAGEQSVSCYGSYFKPSSHYLSYGYSDDGSVTSSNLAARYKMSDWQGGTSAFGVTATWYGSGENAANPFDGYRPTMPKRQALFASEDRAGGFFSWSGQTQICSVRFGETTTSPYCMVVENLQQNVAKIPGGVTPFTGVHELESAVEFEIGDIIVDDVLLARINISNTVFRGALSTGANQKGVIGIASLCVDRNISDETPAEAPTEEVSHGMSSGLFTPTIEVADTEEWRLEYKLLVNALGEGQINVCGEGGTIEKGDLIVTSSMPGKGMKQADDIVRSITVAKARETVTFSSPTEVKQIACIYMCG
jgi:hypothetical protein